MEVIAADSFVYPWSDGSLTLSSSIEDAYQFSGSWKKYLPGNIYGGVVGDYRTYASSAVKSIMPLILCGGKL